LRGPRGTLALGALLLALPHVAAAESPDVRRVEAVGVFALDPELPSIEPPRDVAVRSAVREAVERTAASLLPPDFRPPGSAPDASEGAAQPGESEPQAEAGQPGESEASVSAWLDQVLGDPFDYASRFRILEDRGIRPALLSGRPDVASEYVVVVEVFVDAGRLSERLHGQGVLGSPAGGNARYRTRVILEGAESYASYEALRKALQDGPGVQSALPVEFARGRIVLDVIADREASAVLDDLLAEAPADLQLVPLESSSQSITLLVHLAEPTPAAGGDGAGAADAASPPSPHN